MATLPEVTARALDAVDEAEIVDLLTEFVRVPSVTGTDAEADLQHRCAGLLAEAGMDVDAWKLDLAALRADRRFPGTEAPRVEGYGVVGVTPGTGPPALVLQGHVDVVPTGDLNNWPERDPWSARIRGGALHGRGACDMKAGVVANIAAVRALRRAGVRLSRPLAVHCVVGEEDGGLGAFATLLRGHRGEAAVITEPTSGQVITAAAGALTFRLEVTGRAAHAGASHTGVSAIEAFWPVHRALRELERDRNRDPDPLFAGNPLPYPISVGVVRAGDWASSVPDLLVAEGRLGVRLDEEPATARAALEAAVAATCRADPWLRDHPVRVSWPGGQFASGRLPADHGLIGEVRSAAAAVTGRTPPTAAAPYGSDLRLYLNLGAIPTLHFGPGDVGYAHAPRERVDLAETLAVARTLVALAVARCAR